MYLGDEKVQMEDSGSRGSESKTKRDHSNSTLAPYIF